MLAEGIARPKLQESVVEFLATILPGNTLIELENAHHLDVASSELLAYLAQSVATVRGSSWRRAGHRAAGPQNPPPR